MKQFSQNMKLADLIAVNHELILLLPRFGIELGFGEKTVQQICDLYHVPVDFMLTVCNVYTFEDYSPDIEMLAGKDMSMLVPYLLASHRYYTHERLPHIETHLHHIADRTVPKYGSILKQFYADFRKEISLHFEYEEQYCFPRLQRLQQGLRDEGNGVGTCDVESHGDLVDKLNDLTQIVYKYLPGNAMPEETMELVFDILQLSVDIQRHALIEDKILTPYMEWLERSRE